MGGQILHILVVCVGVLQICIGFVEGIESKDGQWLAFNGLGLILIAYIWFYFFKFWSWHRTPVHLRKPVKICWKNDFLLNRLLLKLIKRIGKPYG